MSPASQGELVRNNRESDCKHKPAQALQDIHLHTFISRARMATRLNFSTKLTSVPKSEIVVNPNPLTEKLALIPDYSFLDHTSCCKPCESVLTSIFSDSSIQCTPDQCMSGKNSVPEHCLAYAGKQPYKKCSHVLRSFAAGALMH